jgi:hypothetical protein
MNVPRSIEVTTASSAARAPEAVLHPLVAVSDHDFQEAYDAHARSIFDDNFEKRFSEFCEHYLVLPPWGENGSEDGEQDFIQLSLSSKDLKHASYP